MTRYSITPVTMIGLAVAAAFTFVGMMTTADAGTRVNHKYYKMNKAQFFNLCYGQKALIRCQNQKVYCGCENQVYRWIFNDPALQNLNNVVRTRSPRRLRNVLGGGGSAAPGAGAGRGGKGTKP